MAFSTYKKIKNFKLFQGDIGDGTSLVSDQSAASDELSAENLSFSDSSGCQGNQASGDFDGPNQEQNSAT